MVMVSRELEAELDAETRALMDYADRVARNWPDWRLYRDGEPRVRVRWWHHLLGYVPEGPLFSRKPR